MRGSSVTSTLLEAFMLFAFSTALDLSEPSPPAAPIQGRAAKNGACSGFDIWKEGFPGATCSSLANRYKLTVSDLLTMNPGIQPKCDNLPIKALYCVAAGAIHPAAPPHSTTVTVVVPTATLIPTPATPAPPPSSSPAAPPPSVTPPPVSSPAVWNKVCTTTPGTCLGGATGTDKAAYTLGCCNGCGPGGRCVEDGPAKGPMTWECVCNGQYRRDEFNGLVGNNGTWAA